ncbi:ATP-binding protein [Thalassotalea sediminis]|uniref:ATP-binding protein n=1 Tax=Thalassotalea sediminis TaxID=1759089 RepID=UPI002572A01B|nr:ATP-binding protein [Thalassotalea sediminis]
MSQLRRFFSSIGVKLFFVFWLTTIASITLTHYLTNRLAQENVILPTNPKDLVKLSRIIRQIEHENFEHAEQVIKYSKRVFHHTVFIKNPATNEIFHSPKRFARPIAEYLRKNEISFQTSILFHFARLSGPKQLNINNTPYQLYIASRVKRSDINETILLLPHWFRFLVPILLSMVFCWVFAKYLTRPIRAMEKAALTIGNGDFKARVEKSSHRQDELGQLANSFNLMADKLENNISAHQRLLADVSHELRSPLTRLQITLGLLDKSLPNTAHKNDLIVRCEKEVMQLDDMISNVLTLSRHENTIEPVALSKCNLSHLLADICDDAQLIAKERDVIINLSVASNLLLIANAELLTSAINNVISNAIKYSPAQQTVDVKVEAKHDHILISVIDHGPGVEQQHLDKLFDPFYRVSDSRDRHSGGTGLGLAIAKQAIDKHNGSITAKNHSKGGLIVTISLPKSDS